MICSRTERRKGRCYMHCSRWQKLQLANKKLFKLFLIEAAFYLSKK